MMTRRRVLVAAAFTVTLVVIGYAQGIVSIGVLRGQGPTYSLSPGWSIVRAVRVTGGATACLYNPTSGDFVLLGFDGAGTLRGASATFHLSPGWTSVEPVMLAPDALLVVFSRADTGTLTSLVFDRAALTAACDSRTDPDCHP
jgi:hypothetical protein